MSIVRRVIATTAAVAGLMGSSAALANPAPVAASHSTRASASARDSSQLGASVPGTTLISIGVLVALIVIVLVATKKGNDSPNSP